MTTVSSSLDEIRPNFLTLSFPGDLEGAFLDDYFEKSLRHVRIAFLLGFFFYGIFGVLDAWLVPDVKEKLWFIRYAVFFPFLLVNLLFTLSSHYKKYMQLSIAAVILVAGLGIIAMILIAPYPGNYLYYAGLILVFLFGYTFFKLRFIWATLTGWMIVIAYEISAILLSETPVPILVNNNFFFLAGNVIGMFACYSIEFYTRRAFLQARQLEVEKKKVTVANQELEKRVEERTVQLVETNEELRQEIAERKKAQEAQHESEARYRDLFEHSNDPVFITSREGKLIDINQSFLDLFGYTRQEIGKLQAQDFYVDQEDRTLFQQEIEKNGSVRDFELKLRKKDGAELDCLLTATVRRTDDGKILGYHGIMRDITERKRIEEEKKNLEAQLHQAQKMEALGTLAGGIAHDFNNLLTGIQGNVSLTLYDTDSTHPHYQKLKGIEDLIMSGANLTKQLLGFSRRGKYEVKPTDMNELIKKSAEMFGRTKKEIIIHTEFQKAIWPVEADRGQIEQVLVNLYVNAWQAMPAGGDLYLQTKNVTLDKAYIKPYQVKPGKYVKVSVTDTGVGMDEKTQQRIFDPFFTTKEMGRGTGLGLASAYGIIKNHGGIINVYTEKGEGTTFNIYLPKSEKKVREDKPITEDILRGSETILLVDDEEAIVTVGSQILEKLGYEVLTATNGKDAIELYKDKSDKIDMVILDMIMPDVGGGETYDRMKELNPNVKVLLSSGYSINGQAAEILERGCRGFIQKPFTIKELSHRVRAVLEDGHSASS